MSTDYSAAGDRRRFAFWARNRKVEFGNPGPAADVVVLSERADPLHWASVSPGPTRIIYDLVDGYLAPSRDARSLGRGIYRWVAGDSARPTLSFRRAVQRLCERADAVVCGSPEQARLIEPLNGNVHVVPDFLEELGPPVVPRSRGPRELNLLWEGLPENVAHFSEMASPLRRLSEQLRVRLTLVSSSRRARAGGRFLTSSTESLATRIFPHVEIREWSIDALRAAAEESDVAVIPLDLSSSFARLKPENKLIGFWRLGIPTVTSRTPAYSRCMAEAGLALTASDDSEWLTHLRALSSDQGGWMAARAAGLAYATTRYSTERLLTLWDGVFDSVLTP